jgi:cell fate (sporulation/competence/biofilm development) regulator YlbF (YheA/YmcA/DUF963 family)
MLTATIEQVQLLEEAEVLSKMILQSDTVEVYYDCLNNVRKDKDAQNKIKRFVKMKEQYEEVQRFGTYHPDYKVIMKDIRELKRDIDLHESIASFKKAETALQQLLNEVSVLVGRSVSEHVKVPTGNPFFDSGGGCGGGCGSGGSCGCG